MERSGIFAYLTQRHKDTIKECKNGAKRNFCISHTKAQRHHKGVQKWSEAEFLHRSDTRGNLFFPSPLNSI